MTSLGDMEPFICWRQGWERDEADMREMDLQIGGGTFEYHSPSLNREVFMKVSISGKQSKGNETVDLETVFFHELDMDWEGDEVNVPSLAHGSKYTTGQHFTNTPRNSQAGLWMQAIALAMLLTEKGKNWLDQNLEP